MESYNLLSTRSELYDVTPHHGDLQYQYVELLSLGYRLQLSYLKKNAI